MFLGISIWLWIAFLFSLIVTVGALYIVFYAYKTYAVQKKAAEKNAVFSTRTPKENLIIEEDENDIKEDNNSFFSAEDDIFSSSTQNSLLEKSFSSENDDDFEYVEEAHLHSQRSVKLQELQYEDVDIAKTDRLSNGKIISKLPTSSKAEEVSSIWDDDFSQDTNTLVSEDKDTKEQSSLFDLEDSWSDDIEDNNQFPSSSGPFPTRRSLRQQEERRY